MGSNSKIIDKVKKLLSLSNGSDSNEAAQSLKKARALMDKHGITATQLAISEIGESLGNGRKYKTPPQYITHLAQMCAELFQCAVFFRTIRSGNGVWRSAPVFAGKSPAEEICS